jgi:hypothetical protein
MSRRSHPPQIYNPNNRLVWARVKIINLFLCNFLQPPLTSLLDPEAQQLVSQITYQYHEAGGRFAEVHAIIYMAVSQYAKLIMIL